MRTGRLRHRATIQKPVDSGGGEKTWSTYATAWVSYEPLRGSEFLAAQQVNAQISGKVIMRYIAGVKADMRFFWEGRYLYIVAPVDVEDRHRELQLMVKESL